MWTLLLGVVQRSNSLLTFAPIYKQQFYTETTVYQVKLSTTFSPLNSEFYTKTKTFLTTQKSNASGNDLLYIQSCLVLLEEIENEYLNVQSGAPSRVFSLPDDIISAQIDYTTNAFSDAALLPVMEEIESKDEINLDVLAFNLFRLKALIHDEYQKYSKILAGNVPYNIIKDTFEDKITFGSAPTTKIDFISAGTDNDVSFAVYSIEILTNRIEVQCYTVLEVANYTLPQPDICKYNGKGITFTGKSPYSPLNMVVQYTEPELKILEGDNTKKIMQMMIPIEPQPFSKNEPGAVKFSNNMANLKFDFKQNENYSPIISPKELAVQVGRLVMNFKSKAKDKKVITNHQSDKEILDVIDNVFNYFPPIVQWILLGITVGTVVLIGIITCTIRYAKGRKLKERKQRERDQIRTVNFLPLQRQKQLPREL